MDPMNDWLGGRLGPEGRVWTALAPALILAAYFLLGLVVYGLRTWRRGIPRDAELLDRTSGGVFGLWIRMYLPWILRPVWRLLRWTEIPANAVTTLSVLFASGAGIALAAGRFALGGWLYLFAGVCDFLDGRLARARGESSAAGAVLDSVLDRYSEAVVFFGLGWYYRDSWALVPVLAGWLGSMLVSYVRARGEAAGASVKVGIMQRPERLILLGAAAAFSPVLEVVLDPTNPHPSHRLAIGAIVLLAVGSNITALRRLAAVLRALDPGRWGPASALRGEGRARMTLLRHSAASVVATGADFAAVVALVQIGALSPALATVLGAGVGAGLNFSINRRWTFNSRAPMHRQAARYAFVSASSALLNASGVGLLLLLPGADYRPAWWIARILVYLAWNYPLQRGYVFEADGPVTSAPMASEAAGRPL